MTKKVRVDSFFKLIITKLWLNRTLYKLSLLVPQILFYVKNRNPKTKTEKLELKKYDPKVRKHVLFKEQKIK